MKIDTSELSGPALDWAVNACEDEDWKPVDNPSSFKWKIGCILPYSADGALAARIMEREKISVQPRYGGGWVAEIIRFDTPTNGRFQWTARGPTLLIAAMRCYVASKLGEKIDVPKELV